MRKKIEVSEKEKYEHAWGVEEYRIACHSLSLFHTRAHLFPLSVCNSFLDIGCGTGRLFAYLNKSGKDAWGFDIATNCLDEDIREKWWTKFKQGVIWDMSWDREFDLGICTDVMEHIPKLHVYNSLDRIALYCKQVVFKIAHKPSVLISDKLHLTVQPIEWWVTTINQVMEGTLLLKSTNPQDSVLVWKR